MTWFSRLSNKRLAQLAGRADLRVSKENLEKFVEHSALDWPLLKLALSQELYGVELAQTVASNLMFENYPYRELLFPEDLGASSDFAADNVDNLMFSSETGTYEYNIVEQGQVIKTVAAFPTSAEFVNWLSQQSDRLFAELCFKNSGRISIIRASELAEFATRPLNQDLRFRKPNL